MGCLGTLWGEALGPGDPHTWGSAPLPRAQGLLSPLLLSRNLLLKMLVLGLLCYHWLSRRVVCSDEEVGAGQQCGAVWGRALLS